MNRTAPAFLEPPRRVVSLVPSFTESLFDLGFGQAVVGVTDFCLHPTEKLKDLPRLGGTKNARPADIQALQPDLVVANQEENTPQGIRALEQAGLTVWLTFPQSVAEALQDLRTLSDMFQSRNAYIAIDMLERSLDFARAAREDLPPIRYFCPIWQGQSGAENWYMTFNHQTYMHDLLAYFGGQNCFADRVRRHPLEADLGLAPPQPAPETEVDTRYPRVSLSEIRAADPEIILLPSEPFEFNETHRQQLLETLAGTSAVKNNRIHLLDGSLLTWHGTRIGKALPVLEELFTSDYPAE